MGNQWVISWLVINYCWWSMNNRWLIEDKLFYGLLITHRSHWCHWLLIDYLLITHLLRISRQLLLVIWRNPFLLKWCLPLKYEVITQARLTHLRRLWISYPLLDICKQSGALNNLLIHFIFDCTCSLIL